MKPLVESYVESYDCAENLRRPTIHIKPIFGWLKETVGSFMTWALILSLSVLLGAEIGRQYCFWSSL